MVVGWMNDLGFVEEDEPEATGRCRALDSTMDSPLASTATTAQDAPAWETGANA